MIKVDNNYARLVGCIETLCARLDGYDPGNPDLKEVVRRHPRIHRVVPVTARPEEYWGRAVPLGDGSYELHGFAAERKGEAIASTKETYERLSLRTLAHELGHVVFWENEQAILAAWGKKRLTHAEFQHVSDLFARVFLMPRMRLHRRTMELAKFSPKRALSCMAQEFHTVLRTLLPWIQQTGATREIPWLIALFRYGYNPQKPAENIKWRLVPGGLVLPRGLSRAPAFEASGVTIYGDPGYKHAGLDTLRLCYAGWEDRRFWKDLYALYAEYPKGAEDEWPWQDLNKPDGPLGGVSGSRISLQPRKLALLHADGLPVCAGLLPEGLSSSESLPAWTNTDWRLGVDALNLFGWSHKDGKEQYVLLTGTLRIRPRSWNSEHA